MELIVLGSGTIVPSVTRSSSAYAVKVGENTIMMDLGPGTLRRMKEANIEVPDVDLILFSHFHPDHTSDFVPFIFASKYAIGSYRTKDLKILAPLGFGEFFNGLIEVFGDWIVPEGYDISVEEMSEGKVDFGGFSVATKKVVHNPESIAFRIDGDGRSLVYSGDTDWSEGLISLAKGADILLLECSFPDEMKVGGHMTPTEAGRAARLSGAKKLVLTHLYPPMEDVDIAAAVGREFGGEIVIASDLMVIDIQ